MIPIIPKQTLVTCLHDLEIRERIGRRSIDFYFQQGALVLGLEQPLVAYVDPELVAWVRESRDRMGLGKITRVIPCPLESLPWFEMTPLIKQSRPFCNRNFLKDTTLYHVIEWSKLDLIEQTLNSNPFDTDHFAWIDFGLGHVALPPHDFPAPRSKINLLQMCAVAPEELQDETEFLKAERGRIAAGFFRGDREHFLQLIQLFRTALDAALARRQCASEQMVLALLTARHPQLFEFYYGDYQSILLNWDHVRGDMDTVFLNIAHCRTHSLWRQGYDIIEKTLSSQSAGKLELQPDQMARLLDESYTSAWYLGLNHICADRQKQLLENFSQSPYFLAHRDRLLSNFEFLSR